jgi:UDPglucose 6-dehydrogenase
MSSTNSFHVVQIGCGVVGYPYACAYRDAGNRVTGIEANTTLVEKYKKELEMYHVNDDLSKIDNVDFILISINTPLKGEGLDLSYLMSSVRNVTTILKNSPNALVVIRSTVPPMTCKIYKEKLEQELGAPAKVLFQPEFLRAATAYEDAMNPWHVVIGHDKTDNVDHLKKLYMQFVPDSKISLMSVEEAEFLKVMHNCYNACKISFFNSCGLLVNSINARHTLDIDVNKISSTMVKTCEGLMNPKYGTYAMAAYAGVCLPKDSAELARLEKVYGLPTTLFQSVVDVNNVVKKMDKEEVLIGQHQISAHEMVSRAN